MKGITTISSMSDIASLSVEVMNKQDFWFNCKIGLNDIGESASDERIIHENVLAQSN
jgi:hypothetical protein